MGTEEIDMEEVNRDRKSIFHATDDFVKIVEWYSDKYDWQEGKNFLFHVRLFHHDVFLQNEKKKKTLVGRLKKEETTDLVKLLNEVERMGLLGGGYQPMVTYKSPVTPPTNTPNRVRSGRKG